MTTPEVIRSRTNAKLKRVGAVRAGKEAGMLLLEGERLVADAVESGVTLELLLVSEEQRERGNPAIDAWMSGALEAALVESAVLAQASTLETPPGVIALARQPRGIEASELELEAHTLLLAVAGLSDPGNLGALARTAEAAGVRALYVSPGSASPWNAKALRGSMGSLLRLPVLAPLPLDELARELGARGVRQAAAATRGGTSWRDFNWKGPLALWVGGETGAEPACFEDFERVSIPMAATVESLNVTVAASLLLFAAGRA
jgi:TrmH family RNA methyltransferase